MIRCTVGETMKKNITTTNDTEHYYHLGLKQKMIYNTSLTISILSLLVTFFIYLVLPDFKTLHGRIVLNNIISVTCMTIYLLIVYNFQNLSRILCIFVGYSGYFSSLSMFTWMTIMCIDLYFTFSKNILASNNSENSKYPIYLTFGWGLPTIMTIVVGLCQQFFPKDSSLNPGIGESYENKEEDDYGYYYSTVYKCFFSSNSQKIWFTIPMSIELTLNTMVFMIMIIKLAIAKWETRNVRLSTNQRNSYSDLKQQLVTLLKLNFKVTLYFIS